MKQSCSIEYNLMILRVVIPFRQWLDSHLFVSAPWPGTRTWCNSTWAAALDSLLLLSPSCSSPAAGRCCHSKFITTPAFYQRVLLLLSVCSLVQLNASWCIFTNEHVRTVVKHLSPSVTHLNLSGYRENLSLDGKQRQDTVTTGGCTTLK